jgi:hypothetical protein
MHFVYLFLIVLMCTQRTIKCACPIKTIALTNLSKFSFPENQSSLTTTTTTTTITTTVEYIGAAIGFINITNPVEVIALLTANYSRTFSQQLIVSNITNYFTNRVIGNFCLLV